LRAIPGCPASSCPTTGWVIRCARIIRCRAPGPACPGWRPTATATMPPSCRGTRRGRRACRAARKAGSNVSQVIRSGDYDLDLEELRIDSEGDRMTLSVGPHHPSTHGVLRMILEIEGERILQATPEIGFLHTGIEKNAEHLTWTQAITVIDRMDYLA